MNQLIQQNLSLFTDPGRKYPVDDINLPFSDYLSQCRQLISATRQDLAVSPHSESTPEHIITANSPFEWQPATKARHGVLLLHGLYDSPFVMQDVGRVLQAEGLLVRSLLLPGHGTRPGALLATSYVEWIQTLRYGLAQLQPQVEKIFLVGFSTGATLILHHLLNEPEHKIAGAVLIAPAIAIARSARLANLPPRLGFDWLHRKPDIDYTKYTSFTFNSAYQIYSLVRAMNKLAANRKVSCPLLTCVSQDDKTVKTAATLAFFAQQASANSSMILYSERADSIRDKRIIQRPAAYSDLHIQNISHICLPIAPDNPHYGKNGDYPLASRVEANRLLAQPVTYGTANNWQEKIFGDLMPTGSTQNRRLTFNPDFDFFAAALREFISSS
jgi:esterase/lipase